MANQHLIFLLGYSKSNIGDEIYYIDPAQADPLPRMDRIGYGITAGFDLISIISESMHLISLLQLKQKIS